jgi:uncharacterized repeat protein (TIGR01451 family)
MKVRNVVLSVGVSSIAVVASIATPALAWHPKGVIVKKVQNVTANSTLSDANTTAQAVAAKPGDTLKYVIEVRNDGAADNNGSNDMAKTVMTDTLPAGVELASNPSQRTITENLGLIKPGQKVVKEYTVKVTASKDGVIANKACFTGDSTVNDNPQKGCDDAVVKVTVPEQPKPEQPKPEAPKPEAPKAEAPKQETPATLPETGPADVLGATAGIAAAGYATTRYVASKRNLAKAHRKNQ